MGFLLFFGGKEGGMGVMLVRRGEGGGTIGGGRVVGGPKRKLLRFCHFFKAPYWTNLVIFFGRCLFLGDRVEIHAIRSFGMYPVSPSLCGKDISEYSSVEWGILWVLSLVNHTGREFMGKGMCLFIILRIS